MRFLLSAAPLLLLAACSDPVRDADRQDGGDAAMPVEPGGGPGDGAAPMPEPVVTDEIPVAFRGVWDSVQGTCDAASDLRIEISPKAIGFYESRGEVTRVEIDNPDRIVVSLAMEGEGEKWEMARQFTLTENGTILTPRSVNEEQFKPVPLKRCES
ncbi:hypothetical protein [Qipengyuania gaetbuli]|uniref:hypothetical protein n=1 Tax=Qipengyuania gaetbuli TaxID=266952 RepID=UPI001CD57620|nr:hypothetical protein [Qipengyuania gaetbuli]MCA0909676.1 hypothetical protein [Qipengyuania gaetbuli]